MIRIILHIFSLLLVSQAYAQHPDTLLQGSVKKFELQNYHGVVEAMNALIKMAPEIPQAYYNRGVAWINLGNTDQACADFHTAQSLGLTGHQDLINYVCDHDYIRELLVKQFYDKQTVYPELGYRPAYTRADTLRGALREERTCFDVYFYDLRVKILPGKKMIEGSNTVYFRVNDPTVRIQIDLFDNYTIESVIWNGNPLVWHRDGNAVFIGFPEELVVASNHSIHITWKGKPPVAPNPPWDGGFVWSRDENKNLWMGVACEHLGASSWWPNKDHLSDKPDSVQITLEVPRGYQAVSNGNLRKFETADKKTDRFTWLVQYPINNYNVTFYVGKYAAFSDTLIQGPDTLSLDYNVLAHNLDIAREHFKQTREILAFYNEVFGFYPFAKDGFGLVESSYEGMEHQSAIAYGNGFDRNNGQDYRNKLYDYIIVHEAAHEWWGNSVTAGDMADIWIHEGFATYAEYLFLEKRFGKEEYLYELSDKSRYIFNVWPLVQNRNVNENTFASNDVYHKGAMLLHCLRCTIDNDTVFLRILRDFCTTNRYRVVSTEDFIRFVNQRTGDDYTAFFKKYLHDTTLPVLEYTYGVEDGDLVLHYRWTGVDEGFIMPFGIETSGGESLRLVAEVSWKETRLAQAEWFNFYNLWKGYSGCRENSFTYYNTLCGNR